MWQIYGFDAIKRGAVPAMEGFLTLPKIAGEPEFNMMAFSRNAVIFYHCILTAGRAGLPARGNFLLSHDKFIFAAQGRHYMMLINFDK
jgi:hypothetical protein